MKNFRFLFLIILIVANSNFSFAKDKIILQLRWDHQFQFAGYYAAKWQGYYEESGLDVEIKSAVSTEGILSAVKEVGEGRAHFGIGAADVLKAIDDGLDLVLVASIFQHSASGFYTRENTIIKSPADFLNLKVARRVNDLIDIEFQALLKAEGIDPQKIKPYPHQPGMDHLISGKVDVAPGYSINIPFTASTKGVSINEFRPIKYGIDFYGDSIFTNKKLVQNNPNLIKRFKTASLKGWEYALENKTEMINKISNDLKRTNTIDDPEKFNSYQSESIDPLVHYPEVQIGHINPARWNRMNEYLISLRIVENKLDLNQFIFDPAKLERIKAKKNQKRLLFTIGAILFLLFFAIVWLRTLKLTVNKKTEELFQTNESLKKSEKKYRDLIELAQEGIWVIDKDNKTNFVNSSMAKMLGYNETEMMGKDLFYFMDQEGKKIALENVKRRKDGIKEQHDFEFICKNGDRIFTTMETAPILDEKGEYAGAIAGIVNITERKIKEKVQETQLRLVEYATKCSSKELLVKFLDETERLTESGIGFYHFYDYGQKQISLSCWSTNTSQKMCKAEKSPHNYTIENAGVWADAVREGRPIVHNDYAILKNKKGLPEGHATIVRELVVPVLRDDKTVAVLGVGNKKNDYLESDVSIVQSLADLAWETVSRKITEELLVENERLLRKIGENYPHSYILIIEEDLKIGFILGQEIKNLEINPNDYIGEYIGKFYDHHTDFLKEKFEKVFKGQEQNFELLINNENYYFRCIALESDTDKIDRILVVSENVSEKRQLEIKLNQAHKMESIGTLAGGIAHDFNNILSSILGFTELALGEAKKGTDLEDDLQEVRTAGMRAKDLVNQILTFARQSEEQVKPIQLNEIINEVFKFIRSSIPSTIELKNYIRSDSFIMGSKTQLHQLLMNLCTNAAHSMEKTGGILEISLADVEVGKNKKVSELNDGDFIELKVSDTGQGISPQHINSIFEPYFTTKSVGEGTGMGLAVVHGIVESYSGKIFVNSNLGKGTTFTIYLPITKKRGISSHIEHEDLPTGDENILFVDDEAAIVKMGDKTLSQLGYKVTTRTSSLEGLELFRQKPDAFDLVITDMTMPNMTGDILTKELIKIRSDIPVILCTGYSKKISEESAEEIGIKAFAYKPMVKSELAKTVRKILDENQKK